MLTKSLQAPYYAVIFVSQKSDSLDGYKEYDELTLQLVHEQDGFLGYEHASDGKNGIFISYWKSLDAIESWRKHPVHLEVKARAHEWYAYYHSQVCKVDSSRAFGEIKCKKASVFMLTILTFFTFSLKIGKLRL